jgi:hypothetical protein
MATVETTWTTTMGVRYPVEAQCAAAAPPDPLAVRCRWPLAGAGRTTAAVAALRRWAPNGREPSTAERVVQVVSSTIVSST